MARERFEWTASQPVIWSATRARLDGRTPRRAPTWRTSLLAAGTVLILFTLALLILAALLVPAAA